jgi:hypothetical protein
VKEFQAILAGESREYLKSILAQAARDGTERELFVVDDKGGVGHFNSPASVDGCELRAASFEHPDAPQSADHSS